MQLSALASGFGLRVAGILCAALLVACGGGATSFPDAGPLDATVAQDVWHAERPSLTDSGAVMDVRGRVCSRSADCDDGVECTSDFCASDGRCVSVADSTRCDDHVYCNGVEACDARRGCVRGTPITCDDNFTCTIDRCDEASQACAHSPRDFDGDGDPDIHCNAPQCDAGVPDPPCWRGGDCDDRNPRVSSRLPEICGDGIDNNCDGAIDEAGCVRPSHDTCADALEVSAGGTFTLSLAGALGDYASRCLGGGIPTRDVVAHFTLTTPRDVSITADGGGATVLLQLGTQCGVLERARDCVIGAPGVYRARALPAGEYWITVAATGALVGAGGVSLQVQFADPTPTPANDTCAGAIDIPATGGTFTGTLVDVADDVLTRCGGGTPDVLYRLTLAEPRDVTLHAAGGRTDYLALSLVDACTRMPTTLRCTNGSPADMIVRALPAGTYWVVVEGTRVPSFTLDVTLAAPTAPVAGDTCSNPITLVAGTSTPGTTAGLQSDTPISCYGGASPDLVYRFTLDRTLDVNAIVQGGTSDYYFVAIQRHCGDTATESVCRYGTAGRASARGLDPGEYFLVVRAYRGTDFTVTLQTQAPIAPVTATANDTCATAQPIPSGGGYFLGNTSALHRDYTASCTLGATGTDAVFAYHADTRQRVEFSADGTSFTSVLWVTSGMTCPGSSVPGACLQGGGGAPAVFDVTLDPGDYWVFLAGFNADASGAYALSVIPLPMGP